MALQRKRSAARWILALALAGATLACGPIFEDDEGGGGTGGSGGALCFSDSDCAPNACCGQGTGVVGASQAPDCSAVTCTNNCPSNQLNCGCGLPVCRDGHCAVAVTTGPGCP